MALTNAQEQIAVLPVGWPETPTIPVRFSVQLLAQMAVGDMSALPSRIQLVELGKPDTDGFYEPIFRLIYPE